MFVSKRISFNVIWVIHSIYCNELSFNLGSYIAVGLGSYIAVGTSDFFISIPAGNPLHNHPHATANKNKGKAIYHLSVMSLSKEKKAYPINPYHDIKNKSIVKTVLII